MNELKLAKLADLKVKTSEYTDPSGKTKNHYQTVGALFGTPHHSRLAIKLYASATNDERWLNVYYDEGKEPNFDNQKDAQSVDTVPDDIDLTEIPF